MPKRRRYATCDELLELLAGRTPDVDWPAALAALEQVGVALDTLVKVEVDEEV